MKRSSVKWFIIWWVTIAMTCAHVTAQEEALVVWSHWAQEPVKVNFMNAVAEGFEQEYGIPVEIVWMPKNELLDKLVFALDTPRPDISYLEAEFSFDHPRISRSLADLSDLHFSGQIDPSWRLGNVGASRNTFIPIEGVSNAIYYNKELFTQAGIVLPQDRAVTTDEFLAIIRQLRAAGITPIGEGSSDREGKVPIPFMNAIFRYAGPEKIEKLLEGELNFSDQDVVKALTFWKQVVDAQGYDGPKALELTLIDGIFEVTDGRAAISFCGTYIYSKYGATERDRGQIGVMDWFTVKEGKGNTYYEIMWAAGFGVNRNSAHLEDAKRFLEYLMSPEAASLWIMYVQGPYPVLAENVPPESLYGTLMRLRTNQQPAPQPFTYKVFQPRAAQQMWQEETRRFIAGERTVEQFIQRMNSRRE